MMIANERMYADVALKIDDIESDEGDPAIAADAPSTGPLRYYTDSQHRAINQRHKRLSQYIKDATEDDRGDSMMIPRFALGINTLPILHPPNANHNTRINKSPFLSYDYRSS